MTVLILIGQFPPEVCGGAEMQCWRQAKALADRGHGVTVLTRWQTEGSPRWETREGVRVGRLGFYLPWMAKRRQLMRKIRHLWQSPENRANGDVAAAALTRMDASSRNRRWRVVTVWLANTSFILDVFGLLVFRRLKTDVIHVHMAGWLAGFGHWLAERMQVPVFCKEATFPVLTPEDEANVHVPWRSAWQVRRMKCRYIALTDSIAGALASTGIPIHRIINIPNGVEVPSEAADPSGCADAIYVGNFTQGDAYKGFDVLLQAWGKAIQAEPDMRLRLFGAGDAHLWKVYAREQGCEDSIVFEGKTDDVWAAHRQAGFLVLPSRREGMSNALLEAMASGLPSVVSDIPGNTAAIRNGVDGLVVPVDDVEALAAAILKLYRSPELRARMGTAAREWAKEKFAMAVVAEQLEAAYCRATDEDSRSSKSSQAEKGVVGQ